MYGNTSYIMLIGNSMHPTIESGTFIISRPEQQYFLGDIIAFVNEDDRNVVHRIVKQTDEGFITKGDNNPRIDPKVVPLENVVGRALFVIPYIGFTSMFLQTSVGMSIFGIFVLAMFVKAKPNKNKISGYENTLVFRAAFIANIVNYALILSALITDIHVSKIVKIPFSNYFEPSIANTLSFCMISIVILVLYLIDHSLEGKKTDTAKHLKLIFSLGGIMILLLQLISIINILPFFMNVLNEQGFAFGLF